MKYLVAALAVSSLVLAAPALAHEPVASASQSCDAGFAVLAASFDNPGYEGVTTVTATDSGGAELGSAPAVPAGWSRTIEGPDRAGGTVTFEWSADDGDNGSLEASYEAVGGCEAPPVTPPPEEKPPPPKEVTHIGGPNPPNGEGGNGEGPPPSEPRPQPADTLPYTGIPLVPVALFGLGLLGAGIAVRRLSRG